MSSAMTTTCPCAGLRACQISQTAQMHRPFWKGVTQPARAASHRWLRTSNTPDWQVGKEETSQLWHHRAVTMSQTFVSTRDLSVLLPNNTLPGGSKCRCVHGQLAQVVSRQEPIWCFVPLQLHHHLLWPRGFPWRKLGKQKNFNAHGLHDKVIPYNRETMQK